MRLIVATNNMKKLSELTQILGDYFEEVLSLQEAGIEHETVEDGVTFEENALKKAREIADLTGCAAVADDSGLEVKALHGAPGVYSARYAGEPCDDEANLRLVLKNMEGIQDRAARFVSAIALVVGENTIVCRGTVEGILLEAPQGDGGFGYDPIFYYPPFGCTLAQVSSERKNSVSHRGEAIRKLVEELNKNNILKNNLS